MSKQGMRASDVNYLAPESLQGLLVGALADAGIDIIAFGADESIVFTTLNPAQTYRDTLIEYARDHRNRASEGGRLLFTREGKLFTLYPRRQDIDGHALDVFTVRHRRSSTVRPGIDWLNAEDVRADFEQSAFGIIEGEGAISPLVLASYEHGSRPLLAPSTQIGRLAALSNRYDHLHQTPARFGRTTSSRTLSNASRGGPYRALSRNPLGQRYSRRR